MDASRTRSLLTTLLDGRGAHKPLHDTVQGFPADRINGKVDDVPYSPWQLMEHIRLAQKDILEFITSDEYTAPSWPDDYWPPEGVDGTAESWSASVAAYEDDLAALKEIVNDPSTDLTAALSRGPEYSILREVLIIADHTSYHTGQLLVLRRALGAY